MKRRGLWVAICLVLSLVFLNACQKPAENANSAAPAPSPTEEKVDTAAIEAELLRIENEWPRIIKERDAEAVKRIEADDAIFVYPDGTLGDKNTDVNDIGSGALSAESWEVMDVKVNVLNKDAAVVSGRSVATNAKYKMPDGSSKDISGQYRFVETYARRNGEWKLVAGVSTAIAKPGASASPMASPAAKPSPVAAASPAAGASPAASITPRRPLPPIRVPLKIAPAPKPTQ